MKFIKKLASFFKLFIQKRKQRKIKKLNTKIQKINKNQPMGLSYIDTRQETNVLDVDLLDNNAKDKDKKLVRQYTKTLITTLTIMAIIWISWSYILATIALFLYGTVEPLITVSTKVCEVVLGAVIAYCLKAFFETFAQKTMELIDRHYNHYNDPLLQNNMNSCEVFNEGEALG